MKKIIKLLLAAVLSFTGIAANAQDIDGISLWDTYTKAQLIAKYGQPVEYRSREDTENLSGLIERFTFNNDIRIRLEGNKVVEFGTKSSNVRMMTKYVSGGIRVGDSESVVTKLEKYLFKRTKLADGRINYQYYFEDNRFNIIVSNGKIVHMYATATTI